METKLYYQDPYIKEFQAAVVKQDKDEQGKNYVVLNQTAFYPTGGGQPHDTGMIGNRTVVNVEETGGEIRHYLNEQLSAEIDAPVSASIDWNRRFDHMQQHCGQHILSAAFEQLFNYQTIGFHLGNEIVTIDLDASELTKEEVLQAEALSNQIILENRPIEIKWVTEEELPLYRLRKETKVRENIRLVIIPEFDYNGCGGTHPNSTGEVMAIKIIDWERQRKRIRVQFVCGNRLLRQLDQKQDVLLRLTKQLNAPEKEMEQAVIRLVETSKSLEKSLEEKRSILLEYEAKEIIGNIRRQSGNMLVGELFRNRTIQELQKLARLITAENEAAVAFLVSENAGQLQFVCARGRARNESMKTIMAAGLTYINGKGGGNDEFAQGGGMTQVSGSRLLEYLLESLG